VAFYLALTGRVAASREPDLGHLLKRGDASTWALLDMALIRQDRVPQTELEGALAGWVVVKEVSSTLNLATLLDIDPSAATGGSEGARAPLRLLRPQGTRETR
jgi:hypothetical protein